jgi:hypothetical protein
MTTTTTKSTEIGPTFSVEPSDGTCRACGLRPEQHTSTELRQCRALLVEVDRSAVVVRCPKDDRCALVPDHAGSCDPRTAIDRYEARLHLWRAGLDGDALDLAIEEGARKALGQALLGS